jgi:hypothetical protein
MSRLSAIRLVIAWSLQHVRADRLERKFSDPLSGLAPGSHTDQTAGLKSPADRIPCQPSVLIQGISRLVCLVPFLPQPLHAPRTQQPTRDPDGTLRGTLRTPARRLAFAVAARSSRAADVLFRHQLRDRFWSPARAIRVTRTRWRRIGTNPHPVRISEKFASAPRLWATGRPSSFRTRLVPCTSATIL